MTDYTDICFLAHSQRQKPFFIQRVLRIIKQKRSVIEKYTRPLLYIVIIL